MAHTQKIAHPVPAVCPGEISLFESAFNHAQIGMAISSIDGTLLSVNQSFASMLGCDPHDIIGRNYREITAADDQSTAGDFVTNLFKTVKTSHTFNKRYVNKSGAEVHSRVTLTIVPATGATEGFVIIQAVDISDMTKLEQNLAKEIEEKDILIKEVHHRVKNNFQVVTSLLNLQEKMSDDEKTAEALSDSKLRIRSMALIHERLYHSDDSSRIILDEYVNSVVNDLRATHRGYSAGIELLTDIGHIPLDLSKAVPIGLIVNEAVTNSLKYAFRPPFEGKAHISITGVVKDGNLMFIIEDNGIGIDPSVKIENPSTLGIYLITMLTRQLKGDFSITADRGTRYVISVPYELP